MNKNLLIKICGMRDAENISQVAALAPDFMGFILYPPSPRYIGKHPDPEIFQKIPSGIKKTAVFVNEKKEWIAETAKRFSLEAIQLHGDETPGECEFIRKSGWLILKAFRVDASFDFSICKDYIPVCDYLLFDTKAEKAGGTGQKFNWKMLENYTGNTPFFLSGGIGLEDVPSLLNLRHPLLAGLDLNSRFETSPGWKDVSLLKEFLQNLQK